MARSLRSTGPSVLLIPGVRADATPADVLELHDAPRRDRVAGPSCDSTSHEGTPRGLTVQGLRLDRDPPGPGRRRRDRHAVRRLPLRARRGRDRRWSAAARTWSRASRRAVPDPPVPPVHGRTSWPPGSPTAASPACTTRSSTEHFLAHGGALPERARGAGPAACTTTAIDNALADAIDGWIGRARPGPVVGSWAATPSARLARRTALAADLGRGAGPGRPAGGHRRRPGRDGGGEPGRVPGDRPSRPTSPPRSTTLPAAPDFRDHDPYTAAALAVRERFAPDGSTRRPVPAWARHGGLAVPTWLYGHEPANLFAGRIAKYFSNAIREDTILRLARGGIVFAAGPGRHGAGDLPGRDQDLLRAPTARAAPFVFLAPVLDRELPVATLLRPLLALVAARRPDPPIQSPTTRPRPSAS